MAEPLGINDKVFTTKLTKEAVARSLPRTLVPSTTFWPFSCHTVLMGNGGDGGMRVPEKLEFQWARAEKQGS